MDHFVCTVKIYYFVVTVTINIVFIYKIKDLNKEKNFTNNAITQISLPNIIALP